MEIAIGAILALAACGLGVVAGFERDRAFYPVMLIVVASYYDLFAIIGGDESVLGVELAISLGFAALAVIGFRVNLWLAVAGLLGHAGLDVVHGHMVTNPGLPIWWPMFCATFDAVAGLYLAWRLVSKRIDVSDRLSFGNRIRAHVDATADAPQIGPDLEGMALLSPHELIVVNDNDFGVDGAKTHFWRVRFENAIFNVGSRESVV
jgi:hypothetical protein